MSWDDNRADKESLISEAWSVADTDDFRWGSNQMADLMDKWKNTGFAGPDDNDRLWEEFRSARQHFFDRRDEDRDRRQRERDDNRADKESLISEARGFSRSTDWQETHDELQNLRAQWKKIGTAGRDYDQNLWDQFNDACNTFYENRKRYYEQRERERENNADAKESLISEAKDLSRSTDWQETHAALQNLRTEWKKTGTAGKDKDQALWERFQEACQGFYDNRKRFYDERQREREDNASRKEDLISAAEGHSRSTDWKDSHNALQDLRAEWKKIRSAGKEEDQRLYDRFHTACQRFYDNRKAAFDKRDAERRESKHKKEAIIRQAQNLVNPSNWDSAHEEMKDLMEDWKRAGSAGTDDQDLWAEFNRIRKNFYEHYRLAKEAARNQRMPQNERDRRMLERDIRKATGTERNEWGNYVERSSGFSGKESTSSIGSKGYTQSTRDGDKRGKTTGHASGDFHKHGSHSDSKKGHHFDRGNAPPSGKIIGDYIKPDKKK